MDFAELATKIHQQRHTSIVGPTTVTLCFDPGHTTGWALFWGLGLHDSGEIDTTSIPAATKHVTELFELGDVSNIVIEDYRIYRWRREQHVGSDMLTTRVIGCIETIAVIKGVTNIIKQPANVAKNFCSNKKLKEWGFYKPGHKHASDAIRHGCYFLLRGAIIQKQREGVTVG